MRCRDKDNPTLCNVGNKDCGNRALQNREYVKTTVFQEGSMGLKADEDVAPGKLVIEYLGEIIDEEEMIRRMENQRILTPSDKEYYIMELYDGVYVDGKHHGNVARFINHSCNPNCELQRWNVHGKIRIGIVAIRDIAKGEPLSYDYQFDTQQADVFKCYCGSHNCRGTMAPKKDRRAQLAQLLTRSKMLPTAGQAAPQTATGRTETSVAPSSSSSSSISSAAAATAAATAAPSVGAQAPSTSDAGAPPSLAPTADISGGVSAPTSSSSPGSAARWMTAARLESSEERELRIQLVREAREKERNRSWEEREREELSRSYVGKYLPGDLLSEIKNGPLKSSFRFARQHGLFLVRNLRPSRAKQAAGYVGHLFLSRRERIVERVPDDWFEKNAAKLQKAAALRASMGGGSGSSRPSSTSGGSSRKRASSGRSSTPKRPRSSSGRRTASRRSTSDGEEAAMDVEEDSGADEEEATEADQ